MKLHERNTKTFQSLTVRPDPSPVFLPSKPRLIDDVAPSLRKQIKACTLGQSPWPMFVFGKPGTGKSCAALCLCDRVERSLFWTEESLCQEMVDAAMDRLENSLGYSITPRQIINRISAAALVVIDELGSRTTVSDHRYSTVKSLLDAREGKSLMIVSNVPHNDIATIYDARIASRVLSGTIVKLDGDDRRLKQ